MLIIWACWGPNTASLVCVCFCVSLCTCWYHNQRGMLVNNTLAAFWLWSLVILFFFWPSNASLYFTISFSLLHSVFHSPPLTSLPAPLLSSVFLGSGCNCWWSMGCISTAWLFPGLQCCSCWSFWLRLQVTVICFNILFCSVTPPPPKKKTPPEKWSHIYSRAGPDPIRYWCQVPKTDHTSIYRSRICGKMLQPLQFITKDDHMYVSVCVVLYLCVCLILSISLSALLMHQGLAVPPSSATISQRLPKIAHLCVTPRCADSAAGRPIISHFYAHL